MATSASKFAIDCKRLSYASLKVSDLTILLGLAT